MEQETNPGGGQGESGNWGNGLRRGECGGRRQQMRQEVSGGDRLPEPEPPRR